MLGALIGAGASLASSLFGNKENKKARKQEYAQQKEFAQSGIQWKVDDAKKAGIHPLYALGANTVSYSPQSVGGSDFSGLASAGQDVGRAIDATRSPAGKIDAFTQSAQRLQLEGLGLDNDLKRTELASAVARARQGSPSAGIPTAATRWLLDGQGNSPSIDAQGITRTTKREEPEPGNPAYVAGAQSGTDLVRNPQGGYSPIMSQQIAEAAESDPTAVLEWIIRNRIMSPIGMGERPSIPGTLPWQQVVHHNYQWQKRDRAYYPNRTYGRFNTRK